MADDELVGTLAGRYRIEQHLGTGGMGQVYRAEDLKLHRPVAVKRLAPALAGRARSRRRLLQEGRSAARVTHQGVAALYDIVEQGGDLFLVMEFVRGETLCERLRRGLDVDGALRIMLECAEALCAAHRASVVHHDIKPANVMITEEGHVKVLDFGLAQVVAATRPDGTTLASLQRTSVVAGTPPYMAPEILLGRRADHRADLFSLGVLFYELLTRVNPFLGRTPTEISDRILHLEPAPLLTVNPAVPPELQRIVSKMLCKDPRQRYATTDDLLVDLRALCAARAGVTIGTTIPGPGAPGLGGPRARRAALVLASAALLLAATAAAPWALRLWHDLRAGLGARTTHGAMVVADTMADGEGLYLALLPLAGPGPGEDRLDVLGAGLAATVTTHLTRLTREHPLQVAATATVAGRGVTTVQQARREIGVNRVLTLHVQRQDARVRVNVGLVDAATGLLLDAAAVDGSLEDILDLQEQVSDRVLRMLRVHLQPMEGAALRAGTDHPQAYAYFVSGEGYRVQPDEEDLLLAIEQYRQALRVDPGFARAHAALGRAYLALYETSDESRWVERADGECGEAIALDGAEAAGHACKGSLLVITGRYEQAVVALRRARDLDPTDDRVLRELGRSLERLQRPSEAEASYLEAVGMRPHVAAPYTWLGGFYARHRRLEEATDAYRQALRLAPDSYRTHSNLGVVRYFAGDWTGARAAFERALEIHPEYVSAWSNLGTVSFFERDYGAATEAFAKATEFAPGRYLVWGNLGDALYWSPGRRADATAAYEEAIRRAGMQLRVNPNDAVAHARTAYYSAMLERPERALAHAARAAELGPESSDVRFKLASTFVRLGRTDEALEHLAHAVELGYSRAEIRANPLFDGLRGNRRFRALIDA